MEARHQHIIQLIWGGLLLLAGVGVFFRIPQVMPKIEQIASLASSMAFIRVCFYLLGLLLIGGGLKKIRHNYKKLTGNSRTSE